ncbi:hypothetical protein [Novipirellula caenicola]
MTHEFERVQPHGDRMIPTWSCTAVGVRFTNGHVPGKPIKAEFKQVSVSLIGQNKKPFCTPRRNAKAGDAVSAKAVFGVTIKCSVKRIAKAFVVFVTPSTSVREVAGVMARMTGRTADQASATETSWNAASRFPIGAAIAIALFYVQT